MSYTIWLVRWEHGEPALMDEAAFLQVVRPYITREEPQLHFLKLELPEGGEADVYVGEADEPGKLVSLSISRFTDGMLDLIVDIAKATDAVIVSDCPTMLTRPDQRDHLPPDLAEHVALIATGDDVDALFHPFRDE